MKLLVLPLCLVSLGLWVGPHAALANPTFTWDDPVTIKSAAQIDTDGKFVQAGYFGSDPVAVQVKNETIVFTPRKVTDAGTTDGSFGANGNGIANGGFSGDTGDPKLNSVLDSFDYDGNSPRVITLDGLKPGDKYEVQLIALDDRTDTGESDRTLRYGDKADFSGSNSKSFQQKENAFVIGHFTADGKKVTIFQDISNNGNFNAYVVRDVS